MTVTPGVVDDDTRELFMRGECLALALALREATGWPIVYVRGTRDGRRGWHVGVEMPDGRVLDAEGAHAPRAWAASYRRKRYRRMKEYAPADTPEATAVMALASSVAPEVLRLAGVSLATGESGSAVTT